MIIVLFIVGFYPHFSIAFGTIWIFLSIPTFYLHIEYYETNKKGIITITEDDITFLRHGRSICYPFHEIGRVILYKSASLDKGGMPILPLELYHYAKIIMKDGEEFIITCLMIPKLEDVISKLKFVGYERKKSFFASVKHPMQL
jgi:hypothetical protein